jgi:hypothetical protein
MNLLKKHNLVMKDQLFEDTCTLVVNLTLNNSTFIQEELDEIAKVEVESLGIY